jgi:hypothetical protein
MDNDLWKEQLEQFKTVYLADGIKEQFMDFINSHIESKHVDYFEPREASELYTQDNNMQYHLNGRSLLGITRKWIYEFNKGPVKHGVSINPGLIQSDHSAFLRAGNMSDIFVEVKSIPEMLDIVSQLLNLSNEQMARKFNIMSSKSDIATLFNAVVLDPIIDSEIQKNNFGGYNHCWNDSNSISLLLNNNSGKYSIARQDHEENGTMVLMFPNGESIKFIQKFKDGKKEFEYTIDDVTTEVLEINGNSPMLQTVVTQIERFSEKKLQKQPLQETSKITDESNYDTETSLEMLDKQIIVKKLQMVLNSETNGDNNSQDIDINEFDTLVHQMFLDIVGLDHSNSGYSSSSNSERYLYWHDNVPDEQYMQIKLPNGKIVSVEFLGKENRGKIVLKGQEERKSSVEENIVLINGISVEEILGGLSDYITDSTLMELLQQKLRLSNLVLSSLETEDNTISESEALIDQQKPGQNIGE